MLLGWSLGMTQPASLVPAWRLMVPPTAFGFVCVGLGLAIASVPGTMSRVRRGAVVCLAAVALILPLLTLFEYLVDVRLGMEAWWGFPLVAGDIVYAGRMSPVTAMAFLLLALALGALPWRAPSSAAAVRLAGGAALTMSWLGAVGLSMDPARLEDAPRFPGMAVPTVMLFATASVGVLWGSAQAVARLRDAHPARALAPYLLVAAFALPIGLGRAHAGLSALVDPRLATALVTAVFSLLVTLVLWRAAVHLQRLHRQRDALLLDLERRVADRTRQLDASQDRLRQADRRKDEFLATLAHELRNPLAPIRTGVELLKLDRLPERERARTHEVIARQMQHLVRLIDDLLDVSRITANKLSLRQDRVDFVGVVHEAVEAAGEAVEAAGHDLVVVLPSAPAIVTGDATRLTQVVVNLLLNACKYTRTGGRIEIAAALDGPRVTLAVRDNGIGIPAPMLPKLFEKFSQVSPPRDRPEGGLGLGLALVRGIVTLHGGSVEVRSEGSGCGSEFIVRLPLAGKDAVASQREAPEAESIRMEGPRRVLVADDNEDGAASLAALLRQQGHEVETAADGEAAYLTAERFQPELILLDIGMPKLNGYDVCRRIRQQPWGRGLRIIAQTGWAQDEDRRQAEEAGFDGYIVKPLDPEVLERVLRGPPGARRRTDVRE